MSSKCPNGDDQLVEGVLKVPPRLQVTDPQLFTRQVDLRDLVLHAGRDAELRKLLRRAVEQTGGVLHQPLNVQRDAARQEGNIVVPLIDRDLRVLVQEQCLQTL